MINGMDTRRRPSGVTHELKLGVCEIVPIDTPLTPDHIQQAKENPELSEVKQATAESNGLFVGCTLCGHTCQLTVDGTVTRDEFCDAAIAERDAAGAPPVTILEQRGPVD
jgi:hypothetical protein